MELILWRHADAENGKDDQKRELSDKGRRQAARIAAWLRPRMHGEWLVLASPALRAVQTAAALDHKFDTRLTLNTDSNPSAILREAHWPDGSRNVIVVGHQPTLGQLAARLLTDQHGDLSIKKGAVWWFSSSEDDESGSATSLRAVMAPDLAED